MKNSLLVLPMSEMLWLEAMTEPTTNYLLLDGRKSLGYDVIFVTQQLVPWELTHKFSTSMNMWLHFYVIQIIANSPSSFAQRSPKKEAAPPVRSAGKVVPKSQSRNSAIKS
ncbi:hypothetical protein PIB30_059573 [Stylosanthes scabra]|uniref:Uncharacterized protein n=1 Tax=Stylosanthes scabra TaxID=79078 RepID=A0ABU6QK61_9FABA|nr:hypothetical protein [Stylosanthes scabra]